MEQTHSPIEPASIRGVPEIVAFALLMISALVLLYGIQGNAQEVNLHGRSAIVWMAKRWSGSGGDLSHGWIIPLVSAYVLWRKRHAFFAARKYVFPAGMLVVIGALAMHWLGYRTQLTRASLLSMIVLIWGIPLTLYGREIGKLLIFPCSYLIFCIPLSFIDSVTVPLRIFASSMSTSLLNGLGIAAMQSGTAIYSTAGGGFNFDVADACSGLRSILAMTALTAVYAYLTQEGMFRKWILFLCAVPLAIVGNIARIVTIAIVAVSVGAEAAMKVYHDFSAFIVFPIAILLMVAIGNLLDSKKGRYLFQWQQNDPAATQR
jgi:exosortase